MTRNGWFAEIGFFSGVMGIASEYFGSLQSSYYILLILIGLDTITGIAAALKYKRFNSKGMQKLIKKIITYSTAIVTVRLLEIGILSLYETTLLTQIIVAFLVITEAISVLENLAILGVPIPNSLLTFLLKNIKIPGLENVMGINKGEQNEIAEIEEIIRYQVPAIEDEHVRRLLRIEFEAWKDLAVQLDNVFREKEDSNDIIYYRVITLMQLTFKEIEDKWKEENIVGEYLEKFAGERQAKVDRWLQKVRSICFSADSPEKKKERIIEAIIILLYQTIIDVRKGMHSS